MQIILAVKLLSITIPTADRIAVPALLLKHGSKNGKKINLVSLVNLFRY